MKRLLFFIVGQFLFVMGSMAQAQQELIDSLLTIENLIAKQPKEVELYLKKAALQTELEQYDKALETYNETLAIMPGNLTALYYRGYVNNQLKRYEAARKDYTAVLLVEPQNLHAMIGLIHTDLADSRNTIAFDGANHIVDLFPNEAEAYATRSEVEEKLNMISAATDDMEHAVALEKPKAEKKYPFELDDDIVSYQLSLFSLYLKQKKTHDALSCIDYLEKNGCPKLFLGKYRSQILK